jgi:hypothetical protein
MLLDMILQQLCQNSCGGNFVLKFEWLDKLSGFKWWKKQEDKTVDYGMLFIVCVINTIVPTKKSEPLIFAFLF